MPPTTRRQSRMSIGELPSLAAESTGSPKPRKSRSRKSSLDAQDQDDTESSLDRKQSRVELQDIGPTNAQLEETRADSAAEPHVSFSEPDHHDRVAQIKGRTFSMEMTDAIEGALFRSEDDVDGNTPDTDNNEQPVESDDEKEAATHAFESNSDDSDESDSAKDLTNEDDIDSDSDTHTPNSDPVPRPASPRRTSIVNVAPTADSLHQALPRIEAPPPQIEEPAWRYVVNYVCAECEDDVKIRQGEPLRCKSCGARMLWKKRTGRMIQFEAR